MRPISPPVRLARHDDEVLQNQHGDEGRQAEIRSADAQGRQRQHDAAGDGGEGAGDEAEPDRGLVQIVEDPGRIGTEPDQEGWAEIHLAGEAEEEIP